MEIKVMEIKEVEIKEFEYDGKTYVKNSDFLQGCDKCADAGEFCKLIANCDGIYFVEKFSVSFEKRLDLRDEVESEISTQVWSVYYKNTDFEIKDHIEWTSTVHGIEFSGPLGKIILPFWKFEHICF